jgi:hypothetical protein
MNIIAKLEAATGPNRNLDALIADAIGLPVPNDPAGWPLRYSESIDAALTLVPEGWAWSVREGGCYATGKKLLPRAELAEPIETEFGPGVGVRAQNNAATPAIALCIAALKVRQ